MNRAVRRSLLLGILWVTVFVVLASFAAKASATAQAQYMCVTIYENANVGGDHWQRCGYNNALYNATLVGDIAGLGGTPLCNTQYWPAAGSDWNDCVSSFQVSGLPSGWRVRLYWDTSYTGAVMCRSSDGWQNAGGGNDEASSWRVEFGSC